MFTIKEITADTIHEICASGDNSCPLNILIERAEPKIINAFYMARDCRRDVLKLAKSLSKAANSMGYTFGKGMDMALDNVLTMWYSWGYFTKSEESRYINFISNL